MNETSSYVTVEDVVAYAIGRTLADEPVVRSNVVVRIVLERIAHGHDLHVDDIIVEMADVMPTGDYTWGVDIMWSVLCVECQNQAVLGETKFSDPMCRVHLDEAYEQELADQTNDDIALGLL